MVTPLSLSSSRCIEGGDKNMKTRGEVLLSAFLFIHFRYFLTHANKRNGHLN